MNLREYVLSNQQGRLCYLGLMCFANLRPEGYELDMEPIPLHFAAVRSDEDAAGNHISPLQNAAERFDFPLHNAAARLDSPLHNAAERFDSPLHNAAERFDSPLHTAAERFDSTLHHAAERFDSPLHHAAGSQTSIVITPRI
jgi:hypothetical protein